MSQNNQTDHQEVTIEKETHGTHEERSPLTIDLHMPHQKKKRKENGNLAKGDGIQLRARTYTRR